MAKPARSEVMAVGDLFGDPSIATPARSAGPIPILPADTATAGGSEGTDAAEILRVPMPSFEQFMRDRYEWSRLAAPWVGVQILLFQGDAARLLWPRAGEMLQAAVMKWLPESGRQIVRQAIEFDHG